MYFPFEGTRHCVMAEHFYEEVMSKVLCEICSGRSCDIEENFRLGKMACSKSVCIHAFCLFSALFV